MRCSCSEERHGASQGGSAAGGPTAGLERQRRYAQNTALSTCESERPSRTRHRSRSQPSFIGSRPLRHVRHRRHADQRAGRTAPGPNRCAAGSTARSASRQPCSRLVEGQLRGASPAGPRPSTRTPTSRIRARSSPSALVERAGCDVDLPRDVGRLAERARPGDRREVGEPHLERHRAAGVAGRAQPGGHPLRQPQQLAEDDLRVVDVGGERLLGADALVGLVRDDLAARRGPRPARAGGRPPRRPARAAAWRAASARGPRPSAGRAGSAPPRSAPPRPTARDRQRVQEVDDAVGGDHEQPVGLARGSRPSLATNFVRRDADRAGDPLLVADPLADRLGDHGGPTEPPHGARRRRGTPRRATGGSTSGVTDRKTSITAADTARVPLVAAGRGRPPAGTAAAPGSSASPSAPRTRRAS